MVAAALLIAMPCPRAFAEQLKSAGSMPERFVDSLLRKIAVPELLYARYSADANGSDSTSTDFAPVLYSIPQSVEIYDYKPAHFGSGRDSIDIVAAVLDIDDAYATVALYVIGPDGPQVVLADRLFPWPDSPIKGGRLEAVRDLTGDGIPDVAMEYYGGQTWQMRAYRWNGADQLLEMRAEGDSGEMGHPFFGRFSVGLEDVDGDGIPEVGIADRPHDLRFDVVTTYYRWNGESYRILKRVYAKIGSPEVKEMYPEK